MDGEAPTDAAVTLDSFQGQLGDRIAGGELDAETSSA